MNWDAVLIGSIASIAVAIIIIVYLSFKVIALMNKDSSDK